MVNKIQASLNNHGDPFMLNLKDNNNLTEKQIIKTIERMYGIDMKIIWIKCNGKKILDNNKNSQNINKANLGGEDGN